ncbi:uncharacterized protein DEA37_0005695 [Paragonimus westermani]|uniref:Uncharacterized protein n=1 Tax=Paragonimus westermani TaxID=34504 RepID=A0A5J4NYL0_9TREM|nr:uncharacterized protein DEA37_0005695 [Paragonimus westermani]
MKLISDTTSVKSVFDYAVNLPIRIRSYLSNVLRLEEENDVTFPWNPVENDNRRMTAEWGRPLFASSLYATSCFILLIMAAFFECHRRETFEAVHRGSGPVPFSVKFSVKGEKVNLYLRLGLAMFGVMSIGHVAVKFANEMYTTSNAFCLYFKFIFEMAFFVLQTLFILRYHRKCVCIFRKFEILLSICPLLFVNLQLVILRYNEVMGAGLVHVLTTNLCIWADISVGKIDKTLYGSNPKVRVSSGFTHQYDNLSTHNIAGTIRRDPHVDHLLDSSNPMDVSFYLLPTVSEYCLLAAALLYEITVRIGQPSFIEIEKTKEGKQVSRIFATLP